MRLALSLLMFVCTGCAMARPITEIVQTPSSDWRAIATDDDRARLRDWREAFVSGLAAARASGHSADIAREGDLFDPDAARGGPIANGLYRCRVIKLGAKSPGMLAYVAYPAFDCSVQPKGKLQSLAKLGGSQRQVGLIFANDQLREVFLGTLMLGDESRAMQYGIDRNRDVAGFVEHIGANRWRLVMPRPHFESIVDVMELVPAS
jgi:hypothetical protein